MVTHITAAQLKQLCPKAPAGRVDAIAAAATANFSKYGITTPLRIAHFFAQVAHESGGFRYVEEIASGAAYEGRKNLGNTETGDGKRFKGHGLIQTTGRFNHREVTKQLRKRGHNCPDFEESPKKLTEFPWAFLSACEYWHSRKLNALADADNVLAITKKVNGGTNGLADRKAYLAKAEAIFADAPPELPEIPPEEVSPDGGMRGDPEVWQVQSRLKAMNYGPGILDGGWGGMTAGAIVAFINDRELNLPAPTSLKMFRAVRPKLLVEIAKAEAENFQRPIGPEREDATAIEIAPKVEPIRETIWSRFLAKLQAIGTGVAALFWGLISWFQDNETLGPIIELVSIIPNWAWIGLVLTAMGIISGLIWRSQRKAEASVLDLHHTGKLQT